MSNFQAHKRTPPKSPKKRKSSPLKLHLIPSNRESVPLPETMPINLPKLPTKPSLCIDIDSSIEEYQEDESQPIEDNMVSMQEHMHSLIEKLDDLKSQTTCLLKTYRASPIFSAPESPIISRSQYDSALHNASPPLREHMKLYLESLHKDVQEVNDRLTSKEALLHSRSKENQELFTRLTALEEEIESAQVRTNACACGPDCIVF